MREVVARAISDPAAVLKGIGEPKRAAIQPLYRSNDLTILNVVWPASFTRMPHNHQMWAVIGVYTGREDRAFALLITNSDSLAEAASFKRSNFEMRPYQWRQRRHRCSPSFEFV